jgi:endoglucanase
MKLSLRTAALVCVLALSGAEGRADQTPEPIVTANVRLGRGINLGNALEAPVEGTWGVTLKPEYFRAIRAAGFDTVRLPTKWSAHAAKEAPYKLDAGFAARVDWAVEQAKANGLNIVLNVHHYEEMDKDPDANLARLAAIWTQIAERYRKRPASVYFELYNEPHDALDAAKWNAAIPVLLAAVRKSNPTRAVIVGPVSWNAIRALDDLRLPETDRNLIVTVHYYEPFKFTHQGAEWVKGADQWPALRWTGSEAEKVAVRKDLEKAASWGRKHGRPVFIGEFGAYGKSDMASRVAWTGFVRSEATRLRMSWAYWEFCAGFGAYDAKTGAWRAELKTALVGANTH